MINLYKLASKIVMSILLFPLVVSGNETVTITTHFQILRDVLERCDGRPGCVEFNHHCEIWAENPRNETDVERTIVLGRAVMSCLGVPMESPILRIAPRMLPGIVRTEDTVTFKVIFIEGRVRGCPNGVSGCADTRRNIIYVRRPVNDMDEHSLDTLGHEFWHILGYEHKVTK
jgi:hypothetical protein